jgi:hypothetical protein
MIGSFAYARSHCTEDYARSQQERRDIFLAG